MHRSWKLVAGVAGMLFIAVNTVRAQSRVKQYGQKLAEDVPGILLTAGIEQLSHSPSEWGMTWTGYGRRVASEGGRTAVQETVSSTLAAALHEPASYQLSLCATRRGRIVSAIAGAVTDVREDGRRRIAVGRIAGAYAGSFAQSLWMPGSRNRAHDTLINGTIALGINALVNMSLERRYDRPAHR